MHVKTIISEQKKTVLDIISISKAITRVSILINWPYNVIKQEGQGGNVNIWLQMEQLADEEVKMYDNILLEEDNTKK